MKAKKGFQFETDEAMNLSQEEIDNGTDLLVFRIVETPTHHGLLVGMSDEIYSVPLGLKLKLLETIQEIALQIVNEPEETRQ